MKGSALNNALRLFSIYSKFFERLVIYIDRLFNRLILCACGNAILISTRKEVALTIAFARIGSLSFLFFSFFIRCYLRIVLNALFSLHKRSPLSVPRFCSILKANEISEGKSEEYDYVREVHDSK